MLKSLTIKNYAIIDDLTIDFEDGFMCFTGETGAGKSIIVGALMFLLRGRSDTSIIKAGKDKAIVEGVFHIEDKDILKKLDDQDIDVYDNEVIVKRVVSSDNRNSIKINQSNVTLSFLENLFEYYVDIHSQKDSQLLYNKKNHLSLLDKYADIDNDLTQYRLSYKEYKDAENKYLDLINNTYNETQIDYIKFDYNELDSANLSLEEEDELLSKEKKFKQAEKYLNNLNTAIDLFDADQGIDEKLHDLIYLLDFEDEEITQIKTELNDIYYNLADKIDSLKNILNSFNEEDLNIEYIEERLFLYSKLKRKHKTDVQGLIKLRDDLADKIRFFSDSDMYIAQAKDKKDKAYQKALEMAKKLHEIRINNAQELEKKVIEQGQDLLLNNINFKINLNQVDMNKNGIDDAEFFVSMNKGENLKPLSTVASGGEVSRLMLAIKTVFSALSSTKIMILDEIDTGVSGKVALSVGEKIAEISKNIQVLVISHLSPVAACAKNQYLIYKKDNESSTYTDVVKLDYEQRIRQLAIISNTSEDDSALKAAKQLLDSCQKVCYNAG